MPVRIKPTYDLGPCVLNLESIQKIVNRVEGDFPATTNCFANDDVWEIFDEPGQSFLAAISQHDTLDSFSVKATSSTSGNRKEIDITFDEKKAEIRCTAHPEHEQWFKHFLIDITEYILPPSFVQLTAHRYMQGGFNLSFMFLSIPFNPSSAASTPYCRIVIRKKPPNPFVENIIANLVSNVIWIMLVFVFGIVSTLIAQNILGK